MTLCGLAGRKERWMAKIEVIFVDEETLTPEEWEVMLSGETEEQGGIPD